VVTLNRDIGSGCWLYVSGNAQRNERSGGAGARVWATAPSRGGAGGAASHRLLRIALDGSSPIDPQAVLSNKRQFQGKASGELCVWVEGSWIECLWLPCALI
jgi:hypothetical protein